LRIFLNWENSQKQNKKLFFFSFHSHSGRSTNPKKQEREGKFTFVVEEASRGFVGYCRRKNKQERKTKQRGRKERKKEKRKRWQVDTFYSTTTRDREREKEKER